MMHTWWTWSILWMGRLVAEIAFFGLIGRLIGGQEAVAFLLVGTTMLAPAYATMFVSQAVRGMMRDGLIPYMIASPAPVFPAALGRAIHWCVDGIIAGSIGLLLGTRVFDLGYGAAQLAAMIAMVVACPIVMMGSGLLLGAVSTRYPGSSNLAASLARALLGLLCGATFTVTFLPGWLQAVSEAIPLTHLVAASRAVTSGSPVGSDLVGAATTGAAWLAVAYLTIRSQFTRARRTGRFV